MKFKNFISAFFIMSLFISMPILVEAQPGDPGPDPDPVGGAIPFDGGLSLLIAAGIGYATKKGYDKRKKKNSKLNSEV